MTMPTLEKILPGFTMGLQVLRKRTPRKSRGYWEGDSTAKVLFCHGVVLCHVDHVIPAGAAQSSRLRFRLVCDPSYTKGREDGELSGSVIPPIQIEEPREVPGPGPDDIGCEIEPSNLPTGTVRFSLEGRASRYALQGRFEEAIEADYLPIVLSCFSIDIHGNMVNDPRKRRFLLRIKVDAASRFPIVANEDDLSAFALPFSCSYCDEEIKSMCRTCSTSICGSCLVHHDKKHKIERVPAGFL